MKKILNINLILLVFILFASCSMTQQIVGEFYLEQEKYDKGYNHFQRKVNEDNTDASSQYYYGRFLLAKKKNKDALIHIKKAVELDNLNADYYSWLGVAYSVLKQDEKEKEAYLKALSINKEHLQSLTYLAHNLYEKKEYEKALSYYTQALKVWPQSQSALFNRALTLNKLKRKPEEKLAWKEYLDYYPSGSLSQSAVKYINVLGNFDYRNHIIGFQTIVLRRISFEPFNSKVDYDSKSSLELLGKILDKNQKIHIHIISYQEENILLAKQRAKSVKNYIIKKYPKIDQNRLKLSWFDEPKKFTLDKNQYIFGELIDFITIVQKNKS